MIEMNELVSLIINSGHDIVYLHSIANSIMLCGHCNNMIVVHNALNNNNYYLVTEFILLWLIPIAIYFRENFFLSSGIELDGFIPSLILFKCEDVFDSAGLLPITVTFWLFETMSAFHSTIILY